LAAVCERSIGGLCWVSRGGSFGRLGGSQLVVLWCFDGPWGWGPAGNRRSGTAPGRGQSRRGTRDPGPQAGKGRTGRTGAGGGKNRRGKGEHREGGGRGAREQAAVVCHLLGGCCLGRCPGPTSGNGEATGTPQHLPVCGGVWGEGVGASGTRHKGPRCSWRRPEGVIQAGLLNPVWGVAMPMIFFFCSGSDRSIPLCRANRSPEASLIGEVGRWFRCVWPPPGQVWGLVSCLKGRAGWPGVMAEYMSLKVRCDPGTETGGVACRDPACNTGTQIQRVPFSSEGFSPSIR